VDVAITERSLSDRLKSSRLEPVGYAVETKCQVEQISSDFEGSGSSGHPSDLLGNFPVFLGPLGDRHLRQSSSPRLRRVLEIPAF
jgi:hypothetical protein